MRIKTLLVMSFLLLPLLALAQNKNDDLIDKGMARLGDNQAAQQQVDQYYKSSKQKPNTFRS